MFITKDQDLTKQATYFDTISGKLFLAAFFLNKLKYIPNSIASAVFNTLALAAYLIGYITWYMATLFYPDHPRKRDAWYGFVEFKEQYQLAAFLGAFATILCLVEPALMLPAMWLFTVSSIVWSISEHHKYKHPPEYDKNYSTAKQSDYLNYVYTTLAASLVASISATLALLFPPIALPCMYLGLIGGNALTIVSLYLWKECTVKTYEPDQPSHSSYVTLTTDLGASSNDKAPTKEPQEQAVLRGGLWEHHLEIHGGEQLVQNPHVEFTL
jgi:hypothetical protein